jgi:hypothetical protein
MTRARFKSKTPKRRRVIDAPDLEGAPAAAGDEPEGDAPIGTERGRRLIAGSMVARLIARDAPAEE